MPTVLFLPASETGHANGFIATAQALLEEAPDIDLHIASYPILKSAIEKTFAHNDNVTFHTIPGPTIWEAANRDPDPINRYNDVMALKPTVWNVPLVARYCITEFFFQLKTEEFVAQFNAYRALFDELKPDVCCVDGLLPAALTASKYMREEADGGRFRSFKLCLLTPNSLKDATFHLEPGMNMLTKWPAPGAAWTMPLPWYLLPLNFYYVVRLIMYAVGDKKTPARIAAIREGLGMPDLDVSSYMSIIHDGLKSFDHALLSSRFELDLPLDLAKAPREYMDKLIPCGPILRAAPPLTEVSPDLAQWMKGGPVVYINFGTVREWSATEAVEVANVVRTLLDHPASQKLGNGEPLRVLWKLKKRTGDESFPTGPGSAVHNILKKEIENDHVRIEDWLQAQPSSILNTGDAICAVTHGGASSFYEAVE